MKTSVLKAIAVASVLITGNVSADQITVGGVTWDPDYDSGASVKDFSATVTFAQWWSSVGTTDNQTIEGDNFGVAITPGANGFGFDYSNIQSPGIGELMGIATFDRFNGESSGFVCSTCSLNLAFGGLTLDDPNDTLFNTDNSWFKVFVSPVTVDPFSALQFSEAQSGSVWLSGDFSSFGLTFGNAQGGQSLAFLNVLGGDALNNFDTNTILDTWNGSIADIQLSGTANFAPGEEFAQASGLAISGNSVPNPTSVALFGLGVLGLSLARRRRNI